MKKRTLTLILMFSILINSILPMDILAKSLEENNIIHKEITRDKKSYLNNEEIDIEEDEEDSKEVEENEEIDTKEDEKDLEENEKKIY